MSLNGALQIGRSALLASQAGLQVAGDNMANATTPGFSRRAVSLSPMQSQAIGGMPTPGRGVMLTGIHRQVDTALQARYRDALSREHASLVDQRFLTSIETILNELTENDVSTLLSNFFNSFSELANNPTDNAVRGVVVQQGQTLADRLASLHQDYHRVLGEIDESLNSHVRQVNKTLDKIADLNAQIAQNEIGQDEASALRDQRDVLLEQLAQSVDVTVQEQGNGRFVVLSGSTPLVIGDRSFGLEMRSSQGENGLEASIRLASDGTKLDVRSGTIGGLLRQRSETVVPMIEQLDTFTSQLIHQVNLLHAQGQGTKGFSTLTGTYRIEDTTAALNSEAANLPFDIGNGSFFIHVTHKETGTRTTHEIPINGDTMSLNDLIAQINTVVDVPHVTASVGTGGTLTLDAEAGFEFTFSDDTSGALAGLGVNTFFTGSGARDIGINSRIEKDPAYLAAGLGHVAGSNENAIAIANLQDQAIGELGGRSLREYWQNSVSTLATRTAGANDAVEANRLVRESLGAQSQAISGVSLDEEAINLMSFQRNFQAAARYISVIDETIQTLLSIA